MIDTLIFSGAGVKGIYYIGAYKSLIKNKIINIDNIKNIICCSSGCIFGLCILLKYSIHFIECIIKKIKFDTFLDYNDLNDLFCDNGLFDIKIIKKFINLLIYHKYHKKNITLKQLFELSKIKLIVKVYNYTDQCPEFFSYKKYPNLLVSDAICMSCCIPIFFRPILYNDKMYIDGGFHGMTPFLYNKKYKNNITFTIINKTIKTDINDNIFKFVNNLLLIAADNTVDNNKKHIQIPCIKNFSIAEFQISDEDKIKMIEYSELFTDIHIYKYL